MKPIAILAQDSSASRPSLTFQPSHRPVKPKWLHRKSPSSTDKTGCLKGFAISVENLARFLHGCGAGMHHEAEVATDSGWRAVPLMKNGEVAVVEQAQHYALYDLNVELGTYRGECVSPCSANEGAYGRAGAHRRGRIAFPQMLLTDMPRSKKRWLFCSGFGQRWRKYYVGGARLGS